MGDLTKAQPAMVLVEVTFREIAAIYDLYGYRRVIGTQDRHQVVFDSHAWGSRLSARTIRDELGMDVGSVARDEDMPGVYQSLRVFGSGAALRTFSRKQAGPIRNKWVYAFASSGKSGENMKLIAELALDGDEFQLVDLTADANNDERTPMSTKHAALYLPVKAIAPAGGSHYWFLLAPYQIPWAGLVAMCKSGKRLASRCQRLFDEFFTDGYVAGGEPQPMFELGDEIKANKPISFTMYLVDPFQEALRRAARYAVAIDAWHDACATMKRDDEYRLAKRLENLPRKYNEVVWNRLGLYLGKKEAGVRALVCAATNWLEDLVRWVGEAHQRDGWSPIGRQLPTSDTWYFNGGKIGYSKESKQDAEQVNPFSELVGDYNQTTTPEWIVRAVGEVVAAVHARLGDMPRGQDFMSRIVSDAWRGELPIADAGAKILFEGRRKGVDAAADLAGTLMKFYAPQWVKAHRGDALVRLVEFLRDKHGIELRRVRPKSVRQALEFARQGTEPSKKAREVLERHYHLAFEPNKVGAVKLSSYALDRLLAGIEVFNLMLSLHELKEERDAWAGVGLLGSTLDAYLVLGKIWPELEGFSYTVGGAKKVIKVAPVLLFVANSIDFVLASRDAYTSTNFGQQAGHSVRAVGAALTVGGAVGAATPAGAILIAVGLGFQALGSWIASKFDDMMIFLRHSKWGETSWLDDRADGLSDKNAFGYDGSLAAFHDDIGAQHRALDRLLWRFEPDFRVVRGGGNQQPNRLLLTMGPPRGLAPQAVWTAKIDVVSRNRGARVIARYEPKATDAQAQASLSAGEEVVVGSRPTVHASNEAALAGYWGYIKIKGEIKLDVYGDGSSVLVETIDENMDLSW